MARMQVTVANLTPSVARLIDPTDVPQLETLILAGESVTIGDVNRWWGRNVAIVNAYGPAECLISTVNAAQSCAEESTNIGKGAGLVTWIVDAENHNKLVPPGCIGELLLEGPLVGHGYLNDAEKTAASFITDPAWLVEGCSGVAGRHGRLYKTGDLVRYDDQGSLIFVERKDSQAKIHGQRMELGEVEHWVRHIVPDVKQVAAEIIQPGRDETSSTLVAFLEMTGNDVVKSGEESEATQVDIIPLTADLKDKLASHLPRYMIPSTFLSIRSLPTTATMKLDRRRLKSIGATLTHEQLTKTMASGRGPKRQPTCDAERTLQRIMAKVLDLEKPISA